MNIDLCIYRARIGLHFYRLSKFKGITRFDNFELFSFLAMILYRAGDVKKNPGPETETDDNINITESESTAVLHGSFSVVHYNVQSVLNKVDIIETEFSNFSLVALTETWLNDSVPNQDLEFNDFQLPFRRDRVGDNHGGILVYVKTDLPCKRRYDLELVTIECLWVEINVKNKNILVGTFYRPPNSNALIFSDIENSIGLAFDTGIPDIIILGDFNLNVLNGPSARKINDLCQHYNLSQIISEPTNFTESSSSIIDLIMVSNLNSVDVSGVGEPFLLQDIRYHCPIFCIFKFKRHVVKPFRRKIWLYEQGNYDSLRHKIHAFDWKSICNDDVNLYAEKFTDKLLSISEECIPVKFVTIRPRDLPWMNNNIRKLMRRRNRLYKKYKKNKTTALYENFKQLRNEVTNNLRKAKKEYIESLASKLKTSNLSSKDYWKTLKSFIKPSQTSSIPPLQHGTEYIADTTDKANLLNIFFAEQSILDDHLATLPDFTELEGPTLDSIIFTPTEVEDILNSLKLDKASGPDNVSNRILKEVAGPLSNPLSDLFNYSMSKRVCPNIWKEANVSPLFKKDDPSLVGNYRPVSLLSTIGKVMEKIIHKHMFNYFKDNQIITCLQSGFVPGDSTVNQLVDIYNTFCKALDEGKEVRAVFLDISKAFDRVWHKGLLFKLKQGGIKATLLDWLSNYLTNRKQRVIIPGGISSWLKRVFHKALFWDLCCF